MSVRFVMPKGRGLLQTLAKKHDLGLNMSLSAHKGAARYAIPNDYLKQISIGLEWYNQNPLAQKAYNGHANVEFLVLNPLNHSYIREWSKKIDQPLKDLMSKNMMSHTTSVLTFTIPPQKSLVELFPSRNVHLKYRRSARDLRRDLNALMQYRSDGGPVPALVYSQHTHLDVVRRDADEFRKLGLRWPVYVYSNAYAEQMFNLLNPALGSHPRSAIQQDPLMASAPMCAI